MSKSANIMEIFEKLCEEEVNKISSQNRTLLKISDTEVFCNRIKDQLFELVNAYLYNRGKFEKLGLNLGKILYESSINIYAIVDFAGTIIRDISINFSRENLNFNFSLFILDLVDIISKAFIEKFLTDIEKDLSMKFGPEIYEKLIRNHLKNLHILVSEKKEVKIPTAKECPLSNVLESFSFKVACSKLSLCEDFKISHERFHKSVILFSVFFKEKKYLAAYLSLESAYNELYKLSRLFSVVQNYRFSLSVKDLSEFIIKYLNPPFYILSLDPKNLAFINKTLGYQVGDNILTFLEKRTEGILKSKGIKYDPIRSHIGAVFFIIYSRDIWKTIKQVFNELKIDIKDAFYSLPYDLDIHSFLMEVPSCIRNEDEFSLSLKLALRKSKKSTDLIFINLYDTKFEEEVSNYKKMLNLVTDDLDESKIKLAIQGIHDIKTGKISHYEILARFVDTNTGKVIPAYRVIDLIYEHKLVDKLDTIVINKIYSNLPKLSALKKRIFINISPGSLNFESSRKNIEDFIKEASEKLKFGIEITEQAVVENFSLLTKVFKSKQIPISLDDFGTGYSSFSRLLEVVENLNVKFLKIDGSYVKKITNSKNAEKIVKAITNMAHALNLKVIAEFVESAEITEKLKEIGVDYGQGYFFSKPKIYID